MMCVRILFNRVTDTAKCNFIKELVFFCEIYKIFKNIFFAEHLQWLLLTVLGNFIRKKFRQRCFSVKLAKFLRTSFDRIPADDYFL